MRLSRTFYERYIAVLYHLGLILCAVSFFLLIPLVYIEGPTLMLQLTSFLYPSIVALLSGIAFTFIGRKGKGSP
jgi:predicted ferric reductase